MSMQLIPVIDLMRSQVVQARKGERSAYRAIESPLVEGSDPVAVARAVLARCATPTVAATGPQAGRAACAGPAAAHADKAAPKRLALSALPILYVADLDALTGGARQAAVLQTLLSALPGVEIWLDAGFAQAAEAQTWCAALAQRAGRPTAHLRAVLGSESLCSLDGLVPQQHPWAADPVRSAAPFGGESGSGGCGIQGTTGGRADCGAGVNSDASTETWILSLDSRPGHAMDPCGLALRPELWPRTVINMTLGAVGANAGPDLASLAALQARTQPGRAHCWVGAGGLRHAQDQALARAAGAQAWLVASALHSGSLGG